MLMGVVRIDYEFGGGDPNFTVTEPDTITVEKLANNAMDRVNKRADLVIEDIRWLHEIAMAYYDDKEVNHKHLPTSCNR